MYKNLKFEKALEDMKKFDLRLTPIEREAIKEYNRLQHEIEKALEG
jgi:hypothetical protein